MQQSVDCESLTPNRGATQQRVNCECLTPTRGATPQSVDCESLTRTGGATQQSLDCESLTPTRGATQQSVNCESLTPTRGATQNSVESKIVPVSSMAPEVWAPKEGGNAMSPLHSRGSPNKGWTKSEVKTSARDHHGAPRGPSCLIIWVSSMAPTPNSRGHTTKRGFKDCPGFLNSTGRLGPKKRRKCYVTPAFSGIPKQRGTKSEVKPPLGVTMMPLGAPSISKYGSLVRPDAQIVALRARCA